MVIKYEQIGLLSLVCFVLLPVKLVYSVPQSYSDDSTLAQTQSEIENESRYLNTLINYAKSHNIAMVSDPEVVTRIIHLSGFEEMIKKHIDYCKDKPAGPIPGEPFYKLWWNSNGEC
jgi:hypothetical protein